MKKIIDFTRTNPKTIARKVKKKYFGLPKRHWLVFGELSDIFLGELNIPKERLKNARLAEAHYLRLLNARFNSERGLPIQANSARRIIENVLNDLPSFNGRRTHKISGAQLKEIKSKLRRDMQRLRKLPDRQPTKLSPKFLTIARDINLEKLRSLLGEEGFNAYEKAMTQAMKALVR